MLSWLSVVILSFLAWIVYRAFFAPYPVQKGVPHGQKKRVVVIGAGVSGMCAAKEMMAEGHEVIIYEKNEVYGGLWNFDPNDGPNHARNSSQTLTTRAYENLITNSSTMVMAFSDFPPQKEKLGDAEDREYLPDYPYHYTPLQYKKYFDGYIDKFGIRDKITLSREVKKMQRLPGDRWRVTVRNTATQEELDDDCDFVCVCVGQHQRPKKISSVKIPGIETFTGKKMHSRDFKNAEEFKGKTVLVIGGGDSASDIVRFTSKVSPGKVFHSCRNGAHILPRYFMDPDVPLDYSMTRLSMYMPRWLFLKKRDYFVPLMLEKLAQKSKVYKEVHRLFEMNGKREAQYFGTKSAMGCRALADGSAALRTEVKEFKGNTVSFQENKTKAVVDTSPIENVDAVFFCIGFTPPVFPFLPEENQSHGHLERYSLIWHPDVKNVAFIGFARPAGLGAIPPISEAQCRWAAQVLSGKVTLPSPEHMKECNKKALEVFVSERPDFSSHRSGHLIIFSYYMAHLAQKIGASPPMAKLFFTNQKLFWNLLMKPFTPMQFRYCGPGANPELVEKTYDMITPRPKLPMVVRQWRKLSVRLLLGQLLAQIGFNRFAPAYSTAYGFWD